MRHLCQFILFICHWMTVLTEIVENWSVGHQRRFSVSEGKDKHRNKLLLSARDLLVQKNLKRVFDDYAHERNVTKADIAAEAGVDRSIVYRVFKGHRRAPNSVVEASAKLLRVPVTKIRPTASDFPLVELNELPYVPVFHGFQPLVRFCVEGILPEDVQFRPVMAAKDRYDRLYNELPKQSEDDVRQFRRKLGFCLYELDQHAWFANSGDFLVVDVENKPLKADRITIWTWDRETYTMGYVKSHGPVKLLTNPGISSDGVPLEGGECIGYIRGVQYRDND